MVKIGEAANFYGVSVDTMRRWDSSGELKPDHISSGGTRYYDIGKVGKGTPLHRIPTKTLIWELLRRELSVEVKSDHGGSDIPLV